MTENFSVRPVVYEGSHRLGDFSWMRHQPEFARSLFVFNDNEEQFVAFEEGRPSGITAGGGNAIARPWQGEAPPRSTGIPTGRRGEGYASLDDSVIAVLNRAFARVQALVDTGQYDTLIFSRAKGSESLGVGIFSPDPDLCRLVYQVLMAVRPGAPPWSSGGTGVTRP